MSSPCEPRMVDIKDREVSSSQELSEGVPPDTLPSHNITGQQRDVWDKSQQWSTIYGASETRNLELDQWLIAVNIYM